jgi:hypothetical protein
VRLFTVSDCSRNGIVLQWRRAGGYQEKSAIKKSKGRRFSFSEHSTTLSYLGEDSE